LKRGKFLSNTKVVEAWSKEPKNLWHGSLCRMYRIYTSEKEYALAFLNYSVMLLLLPSSTSSKRRSIVTQPYCSRYSTNYKMLISSSAQKVAQLLPDIG